MKASHEKEAKEKTMFLKQTKAFGEWSDGLIAEIVQDAKWVTFRIGEEIVTEGTVSDSRLTKSGTRVCVFPQKGCM
jgi:hypothetical protein